MGIVYRPRWQKPRSELEKNNGGLEISANSLHISRFPARLPAPRLLDCVFDGGVAELAYAGDLKSSAFGIVGSSPTAPTINFHSSRDGAVFRSGPSHGLEPERERSGANARAFAAERARRRSRRVPPPLPTFTQIAPASSRQPASRPSGPHQSLPPCRRAGCSRLL